MNDETLIKREFMIKCHPWQRDIWDKIDRQYNDKKLPHALLLHGQPQSDLSGFALLVSRKLMCESLQDGFPCGTCKSCHLIKMGSHPDFQEITFAPSEKDKEKLSKVISTGQIEGVIDHLQKTAMQGRCKVVVIYPVEKMNASAANRLLKSLEEPPPNTYFILVSYGKDRLLATVRSRCQLIELPLPNSTEADHWLATFVTDNNLRQELLAISGGNPLLVRSWLAESKDKLIIDTKIELRDLLSEKTSPLELAKKWQASKKSQDNVETGVTLEKIIWWWRWLLLEVKCSDATRPNSTLALTQKQMIEFMQKLLAAKRQLESSANPNEQLLLESLLIDWQNLKHA